MFWSILDDHRRSVLERVVRTSLVEGCYLAGGTALALLLGHRESVDFDWFSPNPFSPQEITNSLQHMGELEVSMEREGTFHGFLDGVQVTWLYYPRPLLRPVIAANEPNFKLASLEDIGVMKLVSVSQRGAKKDFIDLYELERNGVRLSELLRLIEAKFSPSKINYYHIVKSLLYFEDAEREPMPVMLTHIDWNEVKRFFVSRQAELLHLIQNKQ